MNGEAKSSLYKLASYTERYFPELFYFAQYYHAFGKLGDKSDIASSMFDSLIANSGGKECLQIGVKDNVGKKYAPHWVSVDLYDQRDFIDYHYDIHDLKFPDESFDVAVCISILEHIPYPQQAISELQRVLKPGGEIWVQLPFYYFYHESPRDYWRVSPDGIRIWMEAFEEIECGTFKPTRTALVASTFFYGRKTI